MCPPPSRQGGFRVLLAAGVDQRLDFYHHYKGEPGCRVQKLPKQEPGLLETSGRQEGEDGEEQRGCDRDRQEPDGRPIPAECANDDHERPDDTGGEFRLQHAKHELDHVAAPAPGMLVPDHAEGISEMGPVVVLGHQGDARRIAVEGGLGMVARRGWRVGNRAPEPAFDVSPWNRQWGCLARIRGSV